MPFVCLPFRPVTECPSDKGFHRPNRTSMCIGYPAKRREGVRLEEQTPANHHCRNNEPLSEKVFAARIAMPMLS